MSSAKGASGNSTKNYYDTLVGAICWGPIDWLRAVIHNGRYLFQGPVMLEADITDLTGALADPSYLARGGYMHLYRGTETQSADPVIPLAPFDKLTAKLVCRHLFFGQGTGSAPNLQVIPGRIPRVPTTIVAAEDNVVHEWQVNPIAAFAEFLLDDRGAGYPLAKLHAASWQEAAHWAWLRRDYTFCSPLLTEQVPLRQLVKRWLEPIGAYLRRTSDGQLACHIYEWGTLSGSEIVLDYRHWIDEPDIPDGDWDSVPTEVVVSLTDAAYEYQKNTALVPNALARKIRQLDDQEQLDRRDWTRFVAAQKHGAEALRRYNALPVKATISVRRPFAESLDIGSKVLIDTDRVPGGTGLAQLARVEKIQFDRTDKAQIEVQTDNLAPAIAYTPGDNVGMGEDPTSPPIAHKLAFPLPPAAFGWPLSVGIVATRPTRAIDGMHVFFAGELTDPFAEIGTQYDFACRGQLAGDIDAAATSIDVTELDGETGPEASLAANTPGNATAAQNNTLLILLAQVDGAGRVALDTDGDPVMEFISVIDRSGIGATRSYAVLRGRLDTPAREWAAGASAWILPRGHITEWEPDYLREFAGAVVHFRLVSFNGEVEDETTPVPECSCQMIAVDAPMYLRGLQGQNSKDVFIYQWGDAGAAPALPSTVVTYAFATGIVTGLNNGWAATPPAAPADKTKVLWTSIAPAIAVGPEDTIEPSEWPAPHILTRQGIDGADGGPGTNAATVFIYRRAPAGSPPPLPTAPATFTFATGALTGLNNGWSATPIDTDGNPQWIAAATASSPGATDTINPGEWAAPVKQVKDGDAGASGLNSASIFIYKNAAPGSAPALPSADVIYTFGTGVAAGLNNGWAQAMSEPAAGEVRWISTAAAIAPTATDTIASAEWAAAQIFTRDGSAGGAQAPDPDITAPSPGSYTIHVASPSGAPAGYFVEYQREDWDTPRRKTTLPINIAMTSAEQRVKVWGGAPGYSLGGENDVSWNDFWL